jgi:alpha-glucuronidase
MNSGEDGSKLWLRYAPLGDLAQRVGRQFSTIEIPGRSPTNRLIERELTVALSALFGQSVALANDGALLVGTPENSPVVAALGWKRDLATAGPEGFIIRWINPGGRERLVIASQDDIGLLYGSFELLRQLQFGCNVDSLDRVQRPRLNLRLLNHWDNLDGSIERGYAGKSLWKWSELPGTLSPRYAEYARACASIGINGTVLNNVNANPKILEPDYLEKVAALANIFRPYGIRVYLSANFAAPKMIGGIPTNDPLHPTVIAWWKKKADEIYQLIPDFGGLLLKANSEGQPGPQDYGRTHADGANMLADAMKPHGGIVIWRAFVYDEKVDPDRIKRAYLEFKPLDGKFRDNVMVQVKNGPLDFMPREPFHPLFGAMKQTPVMAEVQAAQEYLGQSKHLVFLGTMWKEFLDADTFAQGAGTSVGKTLEGGAKPQAVERQKLTGMCAVANTGDDVNWCGHDFSQANWYAFGRLAWHHELPAEHIAEEWIRQTFTRDSQTVETIKQMMMSSREIFVNYTMPLGLHHLIGGDHYAPMPWNDSAERPDWTATYYHRATPDGIGVDRTNHGDRATAQYFPPVTAIFDDLEKCPENLLLWFHRLPWDHVMKSGKPLHEELRDRYFQGHEAAVELEQTWQSLSGKIDPARHAAVAKRMAIQSADSAKWRDQCVEYFEKIYLRAGRAAVGGALRFI